MSTRPSPAPSGANGRSAAASRAGGCSSGAACQVSASAVNAASQDRYSRCSGPSSTARAPGSADIGRLLPQQALGEQEAQAPGGHPAPVVALRRRGPRRLGDLPRVTQPAVGVDVGVVVIAPAGGGEPGQV